MALEDRIRTSLDGALTQLRNRLNDDVREIVEQLNVVAREEREEAIHAALADAQSKAEREREADMAALARLLESIRGLDGASSLSEVLDALAQAAAREASRVAVLVLRDERLVGWKLSAFGPRDAQPKTIDLGLNESGVIGLAISAVRPVTTRDGKGATGPGFTDLPPDRMGFAVPVVVSGRVVAVVYADSMASDGREHAVPRSTTPATASGKSGDTPPGVRA